MGRNLIIGDIHSRYEKLTAVLEIASYNPDSDILYSVGDFCDRGKDAVKTLRFLMSQNNLRAVIGNHDIILQNWLYTGLEYVCERTLTVSQYKALMKSKSPRYRDYLRILQYDFYSEQQFNVWRYAIHLQDQD